MSQDPQRRLADHPMTPMQVLIIAVTVGLIALDGFDVLAISFASPGIAREWGIDRGALGIVLAMELLGMALGSVLLGALADYLGRRRTVLICLTVMTIGMAMVTTVHTIGSLCVWRVVTGVGIGGMVAAGNAIATEFASDRRRDLAVSMMAIGYPLGAVSGGSIAALLLKSSDWRAVFEFGACVTGAFIPLVLFCMPESVGWLLEKRPARALQRVNQTLQRIGHPLMTALPAATPRAVSVPLIAIFKPALLPLTMALTITYFLHITTFYFILKWIPKIVVDMGFTAASAAGVLVWANVGGALGGAALGLLSARFGVKALTMLLLVTSTVAVCWFGHGQATLAGLSLVCAVAGFCTNGGVVGLFGVLARAFPTQLRATGTGFAAGLGRGASVLAPIIVGFLFKAGYGLQFIAVLMSVGSLLGALILSRISVPTVQSESPP